MKKFLAALVALTVLVVVVLVVTLRGPAQPRPSVWLVLPDGSSNRIVVVTYGTKHLIGPPLGRMIARLPDALQDKLPVLIHRTESRQPALIVWIEHRANSAAVDKAAIIGYTKLEFNRYNQNPLLFP